MNYGADLTRALAIDAKSLSELKLHAQRNPNQAAAGVATQFEALLLNMLMKSMREATPQYGLFDNDQTRLYTQLLDQQLAQHIAARGTGVAAAMTRQLSNNMGTAPAQHPAAPKLDAAGDALAPNIIPGPRLQQALRELNTRQLSHHMGMALPQDPSVPILDVSGDALAPNIIPGPRLQQALRELNGAAVAVKRYTAPPAPVAVPLPPPPPAPVVKDAIAAPSVLDRTREFVNRVWDHAVDAARQLGVQPHFMVGQAALESGWGRSEIKTNDGANTYNLFGIKAGRSWTGPVVERTTTEYINGTPQVSTEKFRVYTSYADCFRDYANLLRNNPRYANVVGCAQDAQAFAQGLQQAGYATDPAYGDKLLRIINGSTLRRSLLG